MNKQNLEQKPVPELRLNLDSNDEPEEIFFYDPDGSGDEQSVLVSIDSEKSKYALILLIIHTFIQREIRAGDATKIELPSVAREFVKTLASAVTKPSKNTKQKHFLELLFGCNPQGKYLQAYRRKNDVVYILDNVKVIVSTYDDKMYGLGRINPVFKNLLANQNQVAKKIKVAIEVKKTLHQKKFEICSDFKDGVLTFDDEIQVFVEANYSTSLAVFWICSECKITLLFPYPDKDLEIETSIVNVHRRGLSVKIPENVYLPIDSEPGTETCVVIAGTSKFTEKECANMQAILKVSLTDWIRNNIIEKPKYRLIKKSAAGRKKILSSESEGITDSFKLGKPKKLDIWEQNLIAEFPDKVTTLGFLHIPHI